MLTVSQHIKVEIYTKCFRDKKKQLKQIFTSPTYLLRMNPVINGVNVAYSLPA